MRSLKAIAAGCLFIIVVIMFMQLAFIFIAVGYNALAKDYPLLNEISGSFRYIIGIPVFLVTMFFGGYLTATIADSRILARVLLHCFAVGLITAGGMMYSALENTNLTSTGIIVFLLALVATTAGGLYWQKNSKTNDI
jgi:hypothetical protein